LRAERVPRCPIPDIRAVRPGFDLSEQGAPGRRRTFTLDVSRNPGDSRRVGLRNGGALPPGSVAPTRVRLRSAPGPATLPILAPWGSTGYLHLATRFREDEQNMRIGVLTGGGDCPGLNAVIRAVVRKGVAVYGHEFVGFRDGWKGPLEGLTKPLGIAEVRGILPRGGTILGSSRTNPFKIVGGVERIKEHDTQA